MWLAAAAPLTPMSSQCSHNSAEGIQAPVRCSRLESQHILQACSVRRRCLHLSGCYHPQALWTACQRGSSSLEIVPSEANEGLRTLGLRGRGFLRDFTLILRSYSYLSYEMASLWSPHHAKDTASEMPAVWQSGSQPGLYSWIIWLCLLWKGRRDEM